MALINTLVEGLMDEAVAARVVEAAGHLPGVCYGKKGCGYIKRKLSAYNQSSKSMYYLVLVDLMDTGERCSPEVVAKWLPYPAKKMIFRVVAREVESWLIADREGIAKFLNVSVAGVPSDPESLPDPKLTLVNLARKSRSRQTRDGLVPEEGTGAIVGKLYTSEMVRFIEGQWDIARARANARSLDRCMRRLTEIIS
jgi:hypothetical protein